MSTATKKALEAAYLAGFEASAEGYNGEYPYSPPYNHKKPEDDTDWVEDRDNYVSKALKQEGRDWSLLEATQESLREHAAEIKRLRALMQSEPEQPAQQEPVGYWQGEFSKDGGATLYEVPQVSCFGRAYRNIPLYTRPCNCKETK